MIANPKTDEFGIYINTSTMIYKLQILIMERLNIIGVKKFTL